MGSSQEQRSLLDHLGTVPDPRQRQGRRYPLAGLLALLILAALYGQSSLHGMWAWARAHQHLLLEALGFETRGRLPALTTLWNTLQRLDVEALMRAVSAWAQSWDDVAMIGLDEAHLYRSEQRELPAVRALMAAAQQVNIVLQQHTVRGDALEAALKLLQAIPPAGKVLRGDADL